MEWATSKKFKIRKHTIYEEGREEMGHGEALMETLK